MMVQDGGERSFKAERAASNDLVCTMKQSTCARDNHVLVPASKRPHCRVIASSHLELAAHDEAWRACSRAPRAAGPNAEVAEAATSLMLSAAAAGSAILL